MQIRTLNWPQDKANVMDHIRLVHGPGDSDLLEKWYGTMPGFDPADCFVIDGDNGEIASHTMLIPRSVQFGKSILPASEIGVVGTLETYRGRGYATALLDQSLTRMTERGDAVSLIFGIPNFYEKWGYEYSTGLYLTSYESSLDTALAIKAGHWDMSHSHQRRIAHWLGVRGLPITVRAFDMDDLSAVMSLYQQAAEQGASIIARDDQTWRWQLDYMASIGRYDNDEFLVAEHEGTILAYVRFVSSAPINWFREEESSRFSIIEFAGDDPDATEALLATVAATAEACNAARIGLFVHPTSALMTHALARGGSMRSFTGAGFLRLNDLGLTMDLMVDTFKARLQESQFADQNMALRLSIEDATGEIRLGRDSTDDVVELEAPATDMIRLLSGWYGLGNISSAGYSPRHQDILSILFPKGDPKIGIADLI